MALMLSLNLVAFPVALPRCCAYKLLVGQSTVIYKLLTDSSRGDVEKNTMHREMKSAVRYR